MDTRDKRKRLQGIAEDTSSAPHLASLSAASFPARNKCPGTHCRLIELEERKNSSCQKDCGNKKHGGENRVMRTEQESYRRRREEKRSGRLDDDAKTSKELA